MWNLLKRFFGESKQGDIGTAAETTAKNSSATPPTSGAIIAAKVTKVEKHPNADRLRVITLTDGVRTIEPVVCGAFNFDVGHIVALALPGAHIARNIHSDEHEPFTLGPAKIRGVESQGMICAAFEIGASDELDEKPEIMILPETTTLGTILNY